MTIPTQMSLSGFIASNPQLTFTSNGVSRFYARIGVEHARKETNGSFTALEPSFHDLVVYRTSAERAYAQFRKGDQFVASGFIQEYDIEKEGATIRREEFVARHIGHDASRMKYEVMRRQADPPEPADAAVAQQAVGM